jgi:hypothetical protein
VANPRREQSLEGDAYRSKGTLGNLSCNRLMGQRHEGHRLREETKALRGGKALKENPMSVTGMKQGREASEEGSRQEGEKPWSRKVSGEVNPR